MSNTERFLFQVEADTGNTVQKLEQIEKLMSDIERIKQKGDDNYSTTNQKDMDKSMRSMSQLTTMYKQASKELEGYKRKLGEINSTPPPPKPKAPKPFSEKEPHIPRKNAPLPKKREYKQKKKEYDEKREKHNQEMNNYSVQKEAWTKEKNLLRDKQKTAYKSSQSLMKQNQELKQSYQETQEVHRQISDFRQKKSGDFQPRFQSHDINKFVQAAEDPLRSDDPMSRIKDVAKNRQNVKRLDRRTESSYRRAKESGYMSTQQHADFQGDHRESQVDFTRQKVENEKEMHSLAANLNKDSETVQGIKNADHTTQEDQDRKVNLEANMELMNKEIEARKEYHSELNGAIQSVKSRMDELNANDTTVKPERGTFRGTLYERAPAIGLSAAATVAGVATNMYMGGGNLKSEMRDDIVGIGQRTDQDDYRHNVRKQATDANMDARLGFTTADMLGFQDNYLANAGMTNGIDDVQDAMQRQAEFSRSTGMDAATTTEFFDGMFSSGGVDSSTMKDIEHGFIGAIKNSGMEGREKEQLTAMQELVKSNAHGKDIDSSTVRNLMGMQAVLAESGNRSLQGEVGGELMQGLDTGIKGVMSDPQQRVMWAQMDPAKYQGIDGQFALRQQTDKGLSDPANIEHMANIAKTFGGDTEEGQAEAFVRAANSIDVEMTGEQGLAMMKLAEEGKLSEENIQKTMDDNEADGEKVADERMETYDASDEAKEATSENVTEKQTMALHDMGDALRDAHESMGKLPAPLYALTVAITALVAGLGVAALGLGGSTALKGLAAKHMGRVGGVGSTVANSKLGKWYSQRMNPTTVGAGGLPNHAPVPWTPNTPKQGSVGRTLDKIGDSKVGQGAKNIGSKAMAGLSKLFGGGGPKSGPGIMSGAPTGGVGGLRGMLNKSFMPLSILAGGMQVAGAEKGQKAEAAGSAVGGIGGALGGGKAGALGGAAIGSLVLPGVGTAIGAAIGGIGGSIVGSMAGSKIGSTVGGWFSQGDETAPEDVEIPEEAMPTEDTTVSPTPSPSRRDNRFEAKITEDTDKLGTLYPGVTGNQLENQLDRENNNQKDIAENKRGENISQETLNLSFYEKLLNQASSILDKAARQNGIFGDPIGVTGAEGGGGSIGSGGDGTLKYSDEWTNSDLTKHDLGTTDPKLTAEDLDKWIDSKAQPNSLMRGLGDQFLQAGEESGLDPRYLVSHAAHETGWGDPNNGYAKDDNWFGIGAYDDNPDNAKNYGLGVVGGAKWIKDNYYDEGQTTVHDMKFGKKQYATDPQWHNKVGNTMKGAPQGTGKVEVSSNININVTGDQDISEQVANNIGVKKIAQRVNDAVFGPMNYHANEMKRV